MVWALKSAQCTMALMSNNLSEGLSLSNGIATSLLSPLSWSDVTCEVCLLMSVPKMAAMMVLRDSFFCSLENFSKMSFSGSAMQPLAVEAWWRSRTASSL